MCASLTQEVILSALAAVIDPDFRKDIVSLGMVRKVDIEPSARKIQVELRLTTPLCPLKDQFRDEIERALRSIAGPQWHIATTFVSSGTSSNASAPVPARHVWLVASGKGGVGKSTVAFFLALALRRMGHRVGFLDADITGPSLPAMLGTAALSPSIRRQGDEYRIAPVEAHGIQWMSSGFIIKEGYPMAWRGPIISKTLMQLLTATQWKAMDVLVVDLPPGTGDVALTLLQQFPSPAGIIVTTPHILAHEDVRRVIEMFRMPPFEIPMLGIIENMAYFEPQGSRGLRYYPFGKNVTRRLARQYDIPLIATLPLQSDFNTFPPHKEPNAAEDLFLPIIDKLIRREGIIRHARATAQGNRGRASEGNPGIHESG